MRPWVLLLSSKFLSEDQINSPDYLSSDKFVFDWNKHYLLGKTKWAVRVLNAHHPLKELPKNLSNIRRDSLLSYSSGFECTYSLSNSMPIHLVHPSAPEFGKLDEFLSETYQTTGIESFKWETNPQLSNLSFNSYAIYKAALPLVNNGNCAGIFVNSPSEFDVGCRVSVETGLPLFSTFSSNLISAQLQSFENNKQFSDFVHRGWISRIQSLLKFSTGVVFTDLISMRKAFEFASQLWNESIFADYQSLVSGMQLYSDHKIAVASAKYDEISIEKRKNNISLAKSIEQALIDASISCSSHHLNSKHFCLIYPPLDISNLEFKALSSFNNHSMAVLHQKFMNVPSLNGKVFGRASKIIYCQAVDQTGLEKFLQAFSKIKSPTLLVLDESFSDKKFDSNSLIKSLGLENKTILLLSKSNIIEKIQIQSVCDLIVIAASNKVHSEQFTLPFTAVSVSNKNQSAFSPIVLSSGIIPHFASETMITIEGGTDSAENYSKLLTDAIENIPVNKTLSLNTQHVLKEILSAKKNSTTVKLVTDFFANSII